MKPDRAIEVKASHAGEMLLLPVQGQIPGEVSLNEHPDRGSTDFHRVGF